LLWEINGTLGDLRLTAQVESLPVINITPLQISGGRKGELACQAIPVPSSYYQGLPEAPVARNVAAMYRWMAQDLRDGTRTAPSFEDAVRLHKVVAAIETSSDSGLCVELGQ
jgi:predicted dehydrogenase